MKISSRIGAALAGAAILLGGTIAVPQSASAYGITQCRIFADLAGTFYRVSCNGSFLDSDIYAAHGRCNGTLIHSGNYVTPILGGWGPWAEVRCSSGFTSKYYTTGD